MFKQILQYLFAFLVLFAGLHITVLSVIGYHLEYLPGDVWDGRFNNYIFEHGYQSLFKGQGSFWDAPFMYPMKNVTALSDNLLGSLPFYAIFRAFGADRETALQLWYILTFVLNYCAAFFVALKLSKKVYISTLVAFIFAFAMPVLAQANHIQLATTFAIPPVFYFAHRFLVTFTHKYLLFLLLCCVYQIYCSIYLGFLTLPVLIVFVVIHLSVTKNWHSLFTFLKTKYLIVMVYLFLAIILLYPLLTHYLEARDLMGMKPYEEITDGIPRVTSFMYAPEGAYIWDSLSRVGDHLPNSWEHHLFPGITVYICLLFILFSRINNNSSYFLNDKLYLTLALTAVTVIVLVSWIDGFSFFKYVRYFPGLSALKGATRIIFPLLALFSLMLIPFLAALETKKFRFFTIGIVALFVIGEQWIDEAKILRIPKEKILARHRAVLDKMNGKSIGKDNILAVMTDDLSEDGAVQLDAMMVSQQLGIPCINAYSSGCPPGYYFWGAPNEETLRDWIRRNPQIDSTKVVRVKLFDKAQQTVDKKTAVNEDNYKKYTLWFDDFEESGNAAELKYSGEKSFKFDASKEYSDPISRKYSLLTGKNHLWIRVRAKVLYTEEPEQQQLLLVMHFTHNQEIYQWAGYDISDARPQKNKWHNIQFDYLTPAVQSTSDELKVYFWHLGKKNIYIDDFVIEYFEPKN